MAYDYIRQVEVGDTTIPVGHYEIAAWSSEGCSNETKFQVDVPSGSKGIVEVDLTSPGWNDGKSKLYIPLLAGSNLEIKYSCDATVKHFLPEQLMYSLNAASGRHQYSFSLKGRARNGEDGDVLFYVHVRTHIPGAIISEGNSKAPDTEITRASALPLLTEGLDYGDELPGNDNHTYRKGRIFFLKAST